MQVVTKTRFFAIKKAIDLAIVHFCSDRKQMFLTVTLAHEEGEEKVTIRREVLAQRMGFDFYNFDEIPEELKLKTADEYKAIWHSLTLNEKPLKKYPEKWKITE